MARWLHTDAAALTGRPLLTVCGVTQGRVTARSALLSELARRGHARVEVVAHAAGHSAPIVVAIRKLRDRPQRLLATMSARATSARTTRGDRPGAGERTRASTYEVSTARATFGRLVRGGSLGEVCFRALRGREDPCEGCPVFEGGEMGVVPSPDGRGGPALLFAERTARENRVQVRVQPLPPEVVGALVHARLEQLARQADLSEREHEVARLLSLGRSVAEIGTALGISPRTAKFHQANVLRKLGADSRLDLLRLVL